MEGVTDRHLFTAGQKSMQASRTVLTTGPSDCCVVDQVTARSRWWPSAGNRQFACLIRRALSIRAIIITCWPSTVGTTTLAFAFFFNWRLIFVCASCKQVRPCFSQSVCDNDCDRLWSANDCVQGLHLSKSANHQRRQVRRNSPFSTRCDGASYSASMIESS